MGSFLSEVNNDIFVRSLIATSTATGAILGSQYGRALGGEIGSYVGGVTAAALGGLAGRAVGKKAHTLLGRSSEALFGQSHSIGRGVSETAAGVALNLAFTQSIGLGPIGLFTYSAAFTMGAVDRLQT